MLKRMVSLIVIAIMMLSLVPVMSVSAEDEAAPRVTIRIDGYNQSYDVDPLIIDGRTLVPLRGIFESLGAKVEWDDATQTVSASKDDTTVVLTIGSDKAYVNGEEKILDVAAFTISGRTMVPARFVSESLGAIVEWDETRWMVDIYTISREVYDILKKIDSIYTRELLEWLVDVYDPEIGGFYYAISSRDNEPFRPDIESTWQAISIMQNSGIISSGNSPEMPQWLKDKLVGFAQSLQNEDDGYFYNLAVGNKVSDSRRERDLMWGKGTITKFGKQPLYTLPADRAKEGAADNTPKARAVAADNGENTGIPDYLKSAEGLITWMEALPWETDAYFAANTVAAASQSIKAAGLNDVAVEYLAEIQNPETGFWGPTETHSTYAGLNAAMKASGFFTESTMPYQYIDKMIASVLYSMEQEKPNTASALWNPLTLILNAVSSYGGKIEPELQAKIDENLVKLLEFEYQNLLRFKKDDGGFSYYEKYSIATSQGAEVSLGIKESDMNSVNLCSVKFRNDCYSIAGVNPTPFFDIYRDWLWEALANKEPVVKKVSKIDGGKFTENFNEREIGSVPDDLVVNNASGDVVVASDPLSHSNEAIKIITDSSGSTSMTYNFFGMAPAKEARISFKALLQGGSPSPIYYIELGKKAISILFDNSGSGSAYNLSYRTNDSSMGTVIASLNLDEWYKIEIVYKPDGLNNTITEFYVDGDNVYTAKDYYNADDPAAAPYDKIDALKVASWSNRAGTLYLDDISIECME